MKTKICILLLLLSFPFQFLPAVEFTPEEQKLLEKGDLVKRIVWKDGFVWPEVTIFAIVPHAPLENLAAFLDFNTHKDFVPDMLQSKIIKKPSQVETHVYFEMKVPWPVNKSTHTTKNLLTKGSDGRLTVTWSLLSADMLKDTTGHMTFIPKGDQSLMEYVSQIVPNSSFAGMFKNRVAGDVEEAVKKIQDQLKKTVKNKDAGFTARYLETQETFKKL